MENTVFIVDCEFKKFSDIVYSPWLFEIGQSSGTCFAINGFLLTCYHVIDDAINILLRTPWGEFDTKVVKYNADFDLALLEVPEKIKKKVRFLKLGSASSGEECFVYGFPFVSDESLAKGKAVISRFSYSGSSSCEVLKMETNEIFKPGNSGGPLVNSKGEAVGIFYQVILHRYETIFSNYIPFFIIKVFLGSNIFYNFAYDWQPITKEMGSKKKIRVYTENSFIDCDEINGIKLHGEYFILEEFCKKLGFEITDKSKIPFYILLSLVGPEIFLDKKKIKIPELNIISPTDPSFFIYSHFVFIQINQRNQEKTGGFIGDIVITRILGQSKSYKIFLFLPLKTLNGKEIKSFRYFVENIGKTKFDLITFYDSKLELYIDTEKAKIINEETRKIYF